MTTPKTKTNKTKWASPPKTIKYDVVISGKGGGGFPRTSKRTRIEASHVVVTVGKKLDAGKAKWHLLWPLFPQLEVVVRVLENGLKKYSRDNWMQVKDEDGGPPVLRYGDAFSRHCAAYFAGERVDEESGLPTLGHILADALFLLWFEQQDAKKAAAAKP